MVNYDLPWNPNRIEQRFGRIHRIGQTEVCHLWNLVAEETREGDVYRTLLEKLEEARKTLGGQVFDVLGKLQFEGQPLRDLLIQAVRYGEKPEVRARLTQVVANAFDRRQLQDLLEERALAHDAMDASRVYRIREEMERAEARRLQPHYIESFFLEAFQRLGGTTKQREPRRYEVTHVPAPVRNRDRLIGVGEPVLPRYERIAFEKSLVAPQGQPLAAFVCPGHPVLDSTIDLTLERDRDLLRRGAVLVDERDFGTEPRVVFYLEHGIQDANLTRSGERRVVSKRMLYVELDAAGQARHLQYAPYLDYRPLAAGEPDVETILARPECTWISRELEQKAQGHAVAHVVPEHLAEVRARKVDLIARTEAAVKDRLTKEISYWDHRAEQLKVQEQSGKPNARLNSGEARKRADGLQIPLEQGQPALFWKRRDRRWRRGRRAEVHPVLMVAEDLHEVEELLLGDLLHCVARERPLAAFVDGDCRNLSGRWHCLGLPLDFDASSELRLVRVQSVLALPHGGRPLVVSHTECAYRTDLPDSPPKEERHHQVSGLHLGQAVAHPGPTLTVGRALKAVSARRPPDRHAVLLKPAGPHAPAYMGLGADYDPVARHGYLPRRVDTNSIRRAEPARLPARTAGALPHGDDARGASVSSLREAPVAVQATKSASTGCPRKPYSTTPR